jgi:hypothetical protein
MVKRQKLLVAFAAKTGGHQLFKPSFDSQGKPAVVLRRIFRK